MLMLHIYSLRKSYTVHTEKRAGSDKIVEINNETDRLSAELISSVIIIPIGCSDGSVWSYAKAVSFWHNYSESNGPHHFKIPRHFSAESY
jgi:hypothetical protein